MRRILFTGGRELAPIKKGSPEEQRELNEKIKWRVLKVVAAMSPDVVIVGDADGYDAAVRAAATELGLTTSVHKAQWDKHGKAAGPIRNKAMVDSGPDLCIAFPGGIGTKDCVTQARAAGIPVFRCVQNGETLV